MKYCANIGVSEEVMENDVYPDEKNTQFIETNTIEVSPAKRYNNNTLEEVNFAGKAAYKEQSSGM